MFKQKNKYILNFDEGKVDVYWYRYKSGDYFLEARETINTINEQSAINRLTEIQIRNATIFIPGKQVYLKLIKLPFRENFLKAEIIKEVENFIPETINQEAIFWKKIGEDAKETVISVRIIKDSYFKKVTDFMLRANIKIENYFFESEIIAQDRKEQTIPEIVISQSGTDVLITAVYMGNVWQSIIAEKDKSEKLIEQIKTGFEKKWKVKIEKIFEEKRDIFEILRNQIIEKDEYTATKDVFWKLMIIIGLITLFIFVPMIVRNVQQINLNKTAIENIRNN